MPTTNGAAIGGVLGDLHTVMSRLDAAGAAATSHASDVRVGVETLRNDVEDISTTLRTTFEQLAEQLRGQIAQAHTALVAADWSGRSRGAADAAEAQLSSDVRATLDQAEAGVEALGASLRQQTEGFYQEVTGQFSSVMGNIERAYGELSRGTSAFADSLAQADQTISFGS